MVYLSLIMFPFVIFTFYRLTVYRKIRRTGVAGYGRLLSCGNSYLTSMVRVHPVIEFYYAKQRYEITAMGFWGKCPCEVGEEIAILFLEKHPKSVVIKDIDMQPAFIFMIAVNFALCVLLLF